MNAGLHPEMSTGNDIVALQAIDRQRTIQPRFYSKILSAAEQELYFHLEARAGEVKLPFEHFVWLLWSVKESICKYRRRLEPGLVFSPTKTVVGQLDICEAPEDEEMAGISIFYRGIVRSGAGVFYSHSTVHADYISTVVSRESLSREKTFGQICRGVAAIDKDDHAGQSAAVRRLLLDRLSSLLQLGPDALRIEKDAQGCPQVWRGQKQTGIPVSLAHHGRFIAYSLIINGGPCLGSV